jgi:tetraacyldisaccharide 4'-kinase
VLDPYEFRELVSGRRRGPWGAVSRALLRTLEIPYTAAVRLRNRRYDNGSSQTQRAGAPVISVGNITLGGTGKTPMVEWLALWLAQRGVRVGLVSRGYGSRSGQPNDEALELADKLPGVPHVLDPDRVRGAGRAIDEFGCQLVLLDDAFQHRRLARDLDLVLIDALEPFGFEHVFPRGTLREPLVGWARADALVLTRAELVDATRRAEIRQRAMSIAPRAIWLEATHAPRALRKANGEELPLDTLTGKRIAAFAGIGNPDGFRQALTGRGYDLAGMRTLADHFAYPPPELDELAHWVDTLDVAAAVCTHKDLVKIGDRWTSNTPLLALSARLEILVGQPDLEARLELLARRALLR